MLIRIVMLACCLVSLATPGFAAPDERDSTEPPSQRRTRITIYPQNRQLGPNSRRECEAWLQKEYRVSGPVIVPRERCFWR